MYVDVNRHGIFIFKHAHLLNHQKTHQKSIWINKLLLPESKLDVDEFCILVDFHDRTFTELFMVHDAIFKFKRYEDASLTYTGVNKHVDDEVGGWDTTIRKTQYEKLFYNQQYSMVSMDDSVYSDVEETKPIERKEVVKKPHSQSKPVVSSQPVKQPIPSKPSLQPTQAKVDIKAQLDALTVDSIVHHKKFGKGTVVKLNKNEKFIHVKFNLGEKKFVYPDAFLMGFLVVE